MDRAAVLFVLTVSVLAFIAGFELMRRGRPEAAAQLHLRHRGAAGGGRRHPHDACTRHSGAASDRTAFVAHVFCDVGGRRLVLLGPATPSPRGDPDPCSSSGGGAAADRRHAVLAVAPPRQNDPSWHRQRQRTSRHRRSNGAELPYDHESHQRTESAKTAAAVARLWSSPSSSCSSCSAPLLSRPMPDPSACSGASSARWRSSCGGCFSAARAGSSASVRSS